MSQEPSGRLVEITTLHYDGVDPNLARGLAYGLLFVLPVWGVIIASILAF